MRLLNYLIMASLLLIAPSTGTLAADYPNRLITIIVPYPPGGGSDLVARLFGSFINRRLKQNVVVENRPGGLAIIGHSVVASARPDGYTLGLTAPNLTTMKATMKTPRLDAERNFEPISQLTESPYLVAVNASLPVKTMTDFINYTQANAGKLNYGYINGGAAFFTIELLRKRAKLDMVGVPFGGSMPIVTSLSQNEVQFTLDAAITLNPFIESGQIRPIAVTTSRRVAPFMDLPTVAESGIPDFDASFWFGLLAPAGTPPEIIKTLAGEAAAYANDPEIVRRLTDLGYIPVGSSPEAFRDKIRKEVAQWNDISTSIGFERH